MYSIILSVLIGVAAGSGLGFARVSAVGWAVFFGILAAAVAYGLFTLHFKRRLTATMTAFQGEMLEGQRKLQNRMAQFQTRPQGSPQQMLAQLESMQRKLLEGALERTKEFDAFNNWVPLMSRQTATMRMQLNYQMRNFAEAEALMPKCLYLDPISMAMNLAQMYRAEKPTEEILKAFRRFSVRLKYNQGPIVYALMAWIQVQRNDVDAAYKTMLDACKNNEHDTLNRNRDRLANDKVREFSNAGFGEAWYALLLEQPKVTVRRQQMRPDGRPF